MRRLPIIVAAMIVVALVAVAVRAMSSFERRVAAAVEDVRRQVAERANFATHVEDTDVTWLPAPAVVLENVSVTKGKRSDGTLVVENARVVVVPKLGSLLFGGAEVERVTVEGARFAARTDPAQSALSLAVVATGAAVPVYLRDCSIRIERFGGLPVIDVHDVDLDLAAREGSVAFAGTMSPLGERSHADIEGEWRPGAGRTGGDGFKIDLKARDGDPAVIVQVIPELKRAKFTGDVVLDFAAEGYLGERNTESLPGDPLIGRVHAEVGLDLLGLDRRAVFDSGVKLDPQRWVLSDGTGKWGERPFTFAGWIARGVGTNKTNLRLSFKDLSVPDLLAEYDIEERWRPEAVASGEIRVGGSFDYPLTRYEAKAPSVVFKGFPSVPIVSGPITATGSLLAVNAEVSASLEMTELKVGPLVFKDILVGNRWWRDKLTLTSMDMQLWGGKVDGSAAYEPANDEGPRGGGLMHGIDPALFLPQAIPDLGLKVEGVMDVSLEAGYRDGALWYRGRAGVHEGTVSPGNTLRAVLDAVTLSAGAEPAAIDDLAANHETLAPDRLRFRRLAIDYKSQEPGIALRVADLVTDGAMLTLDGTVDAAMRVSAAGVATYTAALTGDLGSRVTPLAELVAEDGTLQVPLRLDGPLPEPSVTLDERFVAEVAKAREGKSVSAFVATPAEPSFDLDENAFPPLEEQFGR